MKMTSRLNRLLGLLGVAAAALLVVNGARAQDKKVDFVKDIQPILNESCVKCHGPKKQKGKLRLDNKDDALKGGKEGSDIVPGNSAKSLLYSRLVTSDKDDLMPQNPDGDAVPLSADKIKLIKAWIDQGAVWP